MKTHHKVIKTKVDKEKHASVEIHQGTTAPESMPFIKSIKPAKIPTSNVNTIFQFLYFL
jgi:hypothetical protein